MILENLIVIEAIRLVLNNNTFAPFCLWINKNELIFLENF